MQEKEEEEEVEEAEQREDAEEQAGGGGGGGVGGGGRDGGRGEGVGGTRRKARARLVGLCYVVLSCLFFVFNARNVGSHDNGKHHTVIHTTGNSRSRSCNNFLAANCVKRRSFTSSSSLLKANKSDPSTALAWSVLAMPPAPHDCNHMATSSAVHAEANSLCECVSTAGA